MHSVKWKINNPKTIYISRGVLGLLNNSYADKEEKVIKWKIFIAKQSFFYASTKLQVIKNPKKIKTKNE